MGRSEAIRAAGLRDADGVPACCINHAVQDDDTDAGFGLLTGELTGMGVIAKDALVAYHGSFRLGLLATVGFPLPLQAAVVGNTLEMLVALRRFGG